MKENNPYAPPESHSDKTLTPAAGEEKIAGLSGWLALLGLGIVLRPFFMIRIIADMYNGIFSTGAWAFLTDPASASYAPGFQTLFIVEILINVILLIGSIYIAILFFTKKRFFKTFFIAFLIITPIITLIDALFASFVFPTLSLFDQETITDLIKSIIIVAIWIPYILVSERVKNTFIN